jgi:hypothetical protein
LEGTVQFELTGIAGMVVVGIVLGRSDARTSESHCHDYHGV